MPPVETSRTLLCSAIDDADENLILTEHEPFGYQVLADTIEHPVVEGDTLTSIAHRYYKPRPLAGLLWYVIGDFQPEPIYDPTARLEPGRVLYVPSGEVVDGEILSERRRPEFQA